MRKISSSSLTDESSTIIIVVRLVIRIGMCPRGDSARGGVGMVNLAAAPQCRERSGKQAQSGARSAFAKKLKKTKNTPGTIPMGHC
jgi:hypothetical protein